MRGGGSFRMLTGGALGVAQLCACLPLAVVTADANRADGNVRGDELVALGDGHSESSPGDEVRYHADHDNQAGRLYKNQTARAA